MLQKRLLGILESKKEGMKEVIEQPPVLARGNIEVILPKYLDR